MTNLFSISSHSRARSVTIDCADCVRQDTASCSDCVVSFLADRLADQGCESTVVINMAEFAALRRLESAGLVPGLRHQAAV